MATHIRRCVWTVHALERLSQRGLNRETVEQAIRERHAVRQLNSGDADWRVDAIRFVVLYDHPHENDMRVVRIVTVWPKRSLRGKRHLRLIGE
jgi:hypothetical protein